MPYFSQALMGCVQDTLNSRWWYLVPLFMSECRNSQFEYLSASHHKYGLDWHCQHAGDEHGQNTDPHSW